MQVNRRVCGRLDCTDCPKYKVGRCNATSKQRTDHECSCSRRDTVQPPQPGGTSS